MVKYMPLNEVCLNIIDCPHETPEWKSSGIPVVRNFNLINGQIDMQDGYYVDKETYTRRTKRAVPKAGDIIFSREAPIGKSAIVPENFKCCLGQRLVLLQVNHKICSSEYLLAALQSSYVRQQIDQVSLRGSIVSNYGIGDLKKLVIPVPNNKDEIGSISDVILKKIKNNSLIVQALENVTKTIYDYWFLQFEFPNEEGKPYKSSGGKMVWNEELKREIPEGWEARTLDTLCTFGNGINYDKDCIGDKEYKIVNVRNITASSLLINSCDLDHITLLSKQADKYIVSDNDILIARSGTPGAVRLLLDNENTIYCGFIIHCLPINSEHRLYLTYAIKQFEGSAATTTGGSILQNVSQDTLKSLNIIAPPIDIIKKFNKTITIYIDRMQQLIKENQQLTSLRDFLLPLLMNGQVTIQDAVKITEKY